MVLIGQTEIPDTKKLRNSSSRGSPKISAIMQRDTNADHIETDRCRNSVHPVNPCTDLLASIQIKKGHLRDSQKVPSDKWWGLRDDFRNWVIVNSAA